MNCGSVASRRDRPDLTACEAERLTTRDMLEPNANRSLEFNAGGANEAPAALRLTIVRALCRRTRELQDRETHFADCKTKRRLADIAIGAASTRILRCNWEPTDRAKSRGDAARRSGRELTCS